MKRFKNRSGVSEIWSFDDSTSKGVLDLLETIYSSLEHCMVLCFNTPSQGIFKGNFRTAQARGSGGRKSPSGVQGWSPGRRSGGRSPPEAETHCRLL